MPLQGAPDSVRAPGFAVAAGLLNHALKPDALRTLPSRALEDARRQQGYLRKVGRWIAESF